MEFRTDADMLLLDPFSFSGMRSSPFSLKGSGTVSDFSAMPVLPDSMVISQHEFRISVYDSGI